MSKLKYYNCGKKGHFAHDCKVPMKVNDIFFAVISTIYVSSYVLLTELYPLRTIDSRCDAPKLEGSLTNRQLVEIPMDIVYLSTHAV